MTAPCPRAAAAKAPQRRKKGLVTAGSTLEKVVPSTALQTPQLTYTTDFTMLTGKELGGERAREKGPDWRGRGGYSHGEGQERGR